MRSQLSLATALATSLLFLVPGIAQAQSVQHDWSGTYIGLALGASRGTSHFDITGGTTSSTDIPVLGVDGTVTLGVNGQNGAFVYGISADGTLLTVNGSSSQLGQVITTALDRMLALRGRLGVATGSMLFFATAGIAAAHQTYTANVSGISPPNTPIPAVGDGYVVGTTYGVGVEVALTDKMSLTAEGVVTNLPALTATGDNGKSSNSAYTASGSTSTVALRTGLNFHF